MRLLISSLTLGGVLLLDACLAAAARVDVVLITPSGAGQFAQDWYRIFSELQVDSLQIRANSGSDKVEILRTGQGDSASYRVIGLLNARNEVALPGGRFTLGDQARLGEWLKTLRTEGADRALGAPRPPFNVPAELLKPVRAEFARALDFDTRDLPLREFLDRVATGLQTPLVVDAAIAPLIRDPQHKLRDELRGLATGVGLAAAVRPAGLVLVPRLNLQRRVELTLALSSQTSEFWPLGWVPPADRSESLLLPELHAPRDVELDEVPVLDLLAVVAERLQTPVLMDHIGIARQGLKPAEVKVSLAPAKLSYAVVLGRMLVKARLRYEIRIDDAGKPFIWIMSLL